MKYIAFLLTVVFVIAGLTGCGGDKATPTDAAGSPTPSQTDSFISAPASEESKAAVQETAVSSQAPTAGNTSAQPKQATGSKTSGVTSSTVSDVTRDTQVSSSSAAFKDAEQTQECEIREYPTFSNEAAMKSWLLSKTDSTEERAHILSAISSNSTICYYRPNVGSSDVYVFQDVEVHTPSGTANYRYNYINEKLPYEQCTLTVTVTWTAENTINGFNDLKQRLLKNEANCYTSTVDSIEYLYYHNVKSDATVIRWMQYGTEHAAILIGHFEQIDQVLPLLKLEKVTLRTDTVNE